MELTAELITDLTNFQFTKEARTEDAKFTELYRIWHQVNADLSEVGKVSVLNHEPTLSKFASRLSSQAFSLKYVELRLEILNEAEPKSELAIMTAFLAQEAEALRAPGGQEGGTASSDSREGSQEVLQLQQGWPRVRRLS